MLLLSPVNVSEGRDTRVIAEIARGFGDGVLDVHADPDHHRAVVTVAGRAGELAEALAAGVRGALAHIDLTTDRGLHPHVGAVDVVPLVHLDGERRGAACAEALVTAEELGRLGLPVYLYGVLAGGRTRAELRRGGLQGLIERGTAPDFGPPHPDPRHGATLVAARPPLVAFNLELAPPATVHDASRIARLIREGGDEGLPGVRALGLHLDARGRAQVTTNVEDHRAVPLADLLDAVRAHAPVEEAELVGLAPEAAFTGWPDDVPIRNRRTIEDALGS